VEKKFELDVWYVDNRSILLDAKIIFLTISKVFRRSGINSSSEETMPEFTGAEDQS
jgi:lipopolysaccharide/colanic/teichoic acid biosynthesis glycosyltransferase